MKKIKTLLLSFNLVLAITTNAQSIDEVLEAHNEIMGYENLAEVNTITIVGKSYFGDRSMPFTTIIKKPSQYFSERDLMGRKMIQAMDGDVAWSANPRDGGINDITGDQLARLKQSMEFGSVLMNWKEKGFELSNEGTEDFEGTEVIKLKLTNSNGRLVYAYLDSEAFVLLKETSVRIVDGNEVKSTTIFSNYKMIDDIAVAFSRESSSEGQGGGGQGRSGGGMRRGNQVYTSVEFNKEVDDSIFKKPKND